VWFGGFFNFSTKNVVLLAARAPFIFNLFFIKQILELFLTRPHVARQLNSLFKDDFKKFIF